MKILYLTYKSTIVKEKSKQKVKVTLSKLGGWLKRQHFALSLSKF